MIWSLYTRVNNLGIEGGKMKDNKPGFGIRRQHDSSQGLSIAASSNVPVGEHPAGRVCDWEGCNTTLARANPNKLCYFHERQAEHMRAFQAPKGKKYKKKEDKVVGL
jgi:hypothetical protein